MKYSQAVLPQRRRPLAAHASRPIPAVLSLCVALAAGACSAERSGDAGAGVAPAAIVESASLQPGPSSDEKASSASSRLSEVLDAQSDERKVRYEWRHPKETLSFFGIEPGMTVMEALPEGGWYSYILHDYLGATGRIIGADYALDMYPLFEFYSDEELADKAVWSESWPQEVAAWPGEGATASAFNFGSMPDSLRGQADVAMFVRALHNLAVFEPQGEFLTTALQNAFDALKPGGVAGVVQHSAPASASAAWSNGENGYLKKVDVVRAFEQAGFVFDGESPVNENPKDRPTEDEYVWRLAPTSEASDDPALNERYAAIGESNRMTLRFIKPGQSSEK